MGDAYVCAKIKHTNVKSSLGSSKILHKKISQSEYPRQWNLSFSTKDTGIQFLPLSYSTKENSPFLLALFLPKK